MPLQTAELARVSRAHVLASLSGIRNLPPGEWLAATHPAAQGELAMGWAQVWALPTQDVIDAVAVSIPTHCVDGWTFAARATSALLAGDPHTCRHMAYYAQLRAALCILANLGVGLFNGVNLGIDAAGQVVRIDPTGNNKKGDGTHKIVWATLKEWGQDANLAQAFLDLLRFKHVPVRDILEALWPGFMAVTTVGTLVASWGVDLQRGVDDHKFRNNSSYAPQALNPIPMRTATNLGYVDRLWRLFEPSGGSGFDNLDRHLIRKILLAQHGMSEPGLAADQGAIEHFYGNIPASIRLLCPKAFVLSAASTPEILRNANVRANPAKPLHMLSRAILLLRTATAFTHSSLVDAGIDVAAGDLTAWLDQIAVARGFCREGEGIGNGSELWDDLRLAIDELEVSRTPAPIDLMAWKAQLPNGLPRVTEVERIALWSLCA